MQIRHNLLGGAVRHQDQLGTSFAVIPTNSTHGKKVIARRISIRVTDGQTHWLNNPNTIVVAACRQRRREPEGDRHSHEVQIEIAARRPPDGGPNASAT